MRVMTGSITAILLVVGTSAFSQDVSTTPNFSMVPENCNIYVMSKGWGIKCPSKVNERIANNARNQALPILPGHDSNNNAYTPSTLGHPTKCVVAIENLVKRAGQFTSWLRRVRFGGEFYGRLTADAAYEVGELIHSYTIQVEREGKRKYNLSPRGGNGDALCTQHIEFGTSEIIRIAQIVIDEANKGNRDLSGTGLNPYASQYNR